MGVTLLLWFEAQPTHSWFASGTLRLSFGLGLISVANVYFLLLSCLPLPLTAPCLPSPSSSSSFLSFPCLLLQGPLLVTVPLTKL